MYGLFFFVKLFNAVHVPVVLAWLIFLLSGEPYLALLLVILGVWAVGRQCNDFRSRQRGVLVGRRTLELGLLLNNPQKHGGRAPS